MAGSLRLDRPLAEEEVFGLARLAIAGITREYPNKPGNVLAGPEDLKSPREMHPAFYGCFDWHSAVHGHWTLIRLLRLYPALEALRAEALPPLSKNLSAENLRKETAYFQLERNRSFERTYGWAWLTRLAQEARAWETADGAAFARNLEPLEQCIVERACAYLLDLPGPIRSGEHPDTAFALSFFFDYATAVGNTDLRERVEERALAWHAGDGACPIEFEPSAHDFFSPCLNVADLMRRVLPRERFDPWLRCFLPGLERSNEGHLFRPARVVDALDGKLVHQVGLELTRAWTMRGVASALTERDPRKDCLLALAQEHADAGFAHVFTGDYAGEHWLASFAVYLLTDAGL